MDTVRISVRLKSPIIIQGYLTLDALLAALLFEQLGDVDAAHAAIPVHCEDGLYHASAAIVDPHGYGPASFAASLRAEHDLNPDWIKKKGVTQKLHRKLGKTRRRDLGMVMSNYQSIYTPTVSWVCTGELSLIKPLLKDLNSIGKKHAQGFGEIEAGSWEVVETEESPLVAPDGSPMRPIPETMFQGDRSYPLQDVGWRPAYWNPQHRAICYAPAGVLS